MVTPIPTRSQTRLRELVAERAFADASFANSADGVGNFGLGFVFPFVRPDPGTGRGGSGAVDELFARAVETGPPTAALASRVAREADFVGMGNAALLAVALESPFGPPERLRMFAELPPERANNPRLEENSTRASGGCCPERTADGPASACTSGQSVGISRSGGGGTGMLAHSASASATSIGC